MKAPKSKVDAVGKASAKAEKSARPKEIVNPYAVSPEQAAIAVRRAGIVTATGKLSRLFK